MKKCVIYGRVSSQQQDYDRQINELDVWASKNGYKVVERFAEKITGVSKAGERKEFNRLLSFIKEHDVKMILVSELSRIGRLGVHTRLEIENLAEQGVNIFFYDKNQYTLDHQGKVDSHTMMMIGIVLDLAKIEVENTRNRIKSGLKNSAKNGKIQSSKFKPYGFTSDEDKNIVVNEKELEVVKKMFSLFDSGMTTNNITAYLNENKVPTRFNDFAGTIINGRKAESYSWNTRTVYRILTNRMFIGERWHKGEMVFKFNPVIDVDLFNRVLEKLKEKRNRSIKTVKNNNYLKGLIFCRCGCGMFMNVDKTKRVNSYVCLSKTYAKLKKQEACKNPSVNIDKLLSSSYLILMQKYISQMKSKVKVNFDEKISLKNIELNNSTSALSKLQMKLDNLYDDYNERLITKSQYLKRKESFERQIENETNNNAELKRDLQQLQQLKEKPLKDSYTYDQYLLELRNIVKKVVVGRGDEQTEKLIKKTRTDIAIKIAITTVTDEQITYSISKFSDSIVANFQLTNGAYKMVH